jgi:hypothetical protein
MRSSALSLLLLLSGSGLLQLPGQTGLMVWVDRDQPGKPCPLHTELSINGKLIDVLSTEAQKDIDRQLQNGWNTIVLKTSAKGIAKEPNHLAFRLGATRSAEKKNQLAMDPILWEFRNRHGWEWRDGKFNNRRDPQAKEVVQSFKVWYAGLEHEPEKLQIKDGDYVLSVSSRLPDDVPVLATVSVNGKALNTFVGNRRNVVVTPLLKEGVNELKLVATRVADCNTDNELKVQLVGPARFNAQKKMHEFPPIRELSSLEDWDRDAQTGQYTNRLQPGGETTERTVPFVVTELPKAGGK